MLPPQGIDWPTPRLGELSCEGLTTLDNANIVKVAYEKLQFNFMRYNKTYFVRPLALYTGDFTTGGVK